MFNIRNRLIIQDLIEELDKNKLNYEVVIDKTIKDGEIIFSSIRIEGKEKWLK